jgi:tetratricopeptide (TPR) repeat protein
MKRVYIFILLLSLSYLSNDAQKMPSDYFDEAEQFFEAKEYKNSITTYKYIVVNHPKNELYPKAYYNLGYTLYIDKQYDSSIIVFKSILKGNFNEMESSGGGIMNDPYANYRHRSSELLSEIYEKKGDFAAALQYFALADTAYPYLHFCGNEYASNDVHSALRYSLLYQKLNNTDKAIEYLLPAVFITLADNFKVISELKSLLRNKKGIKKDLDLALANIYSKTIQTKDYNYKRHYFKFLNAEIAVPGGYVGENETFDKDKSVQEIRRTDFYKMIKKI